MQETLFLTDFKEVGGSRHVRFFVCMTTIPPNMNQF